MRRNRRTVMGHYAPPPRPTLRATALVAGLVSALWLAMLALF